MLYFLQEQYVNLLTDFGFKRVFGLEPNKQLLVDFLNTLLPAHHQIKELSYKSTENLGNTPIDHTIVHMVELKDQHCNVFYDKLKFIYIELPKFNKTLEQLESQQDKWLYLLRHLPDIEGHPRPFQDPVFLQLFEVAKLANFSPAEQDSYQSSLKYY